MRNRKPKRILRTENLENRRVMAASLGWDGPGQGSAALTFTVDASGSGLSQQAAEDAIDRAFEAWSDVADISFSKTEQVGLRDSLDISFRSIDGSGGTLAQAYFPDDVNPARIAGDIQFDIAETWEVGNRLGSRAFDLVQVAVHEIGHALGLEHDHTSGSILRSTVSPHASFAALGRSDVDAILKQYAPAQATPQSPTVNPPTVTTTSVQPTIQTNVPDATDTGNENRTDTSPEDQPPRDSSPWSRLWNRWVNRFRQRFNFHWDAPGDNGSGQDTGNDTPSITPTVTIRWFTPRVRWR